VLLPLAYLTVANTFAVLRLLPMTDRDKDAEILALRHQIGVLQRHLGSKTVTFTRRTGRSSPHSYIPGPVRSCAGCS
jgi:hypothetical protein